MRATAAFLLMLALRGAATAQLPVFEDATDLAGLGQVVLAWGVAVADMDGDGLWDLVFANQDDDTVILRNEGGLVFDAMPLGDGGQEGGVEVVAPADTDGNGSMELLTARWAGRPGLWRHEGDLFFTETTEESGLAQEQVRRTAGAAWGDINGDGVLDLVMGRYEAGDALFLGNGDGSFTDVTDQMQLGEGTGTEGLTCVDVDNDADMDVFCSRARARCALFINEGGSPSGSIVLTDQAPKLGVAAAGPNFGQVFFDMDNDGDLDLYLLRGGWETEANRLYRNTLAETGMLEFEPATLEAGIGDEGAAWGCAVGDIDLDGDQDLFLNNHNGPSHLYFNNGEGTFVEETPDEMVQMGSSCLGTVLADLDEDGDLELVVRVVDGPDRMFRNVTDSGNWLKVRVRLTKGNTFGYGAHVMVYPAGHLGEAEALVGMREIGTHQGWCSVPPPEAHFGLPAGETYDVLAVAPGGIRLTATGVAAGTVVELQGP